MSFLGRVFNHFFNQVLVEGLANSRTFQRFAVKTNQMVVDATKKSAEHQQRLQEQAQVFSKTFREEVKKGVDEHGKNAGR